MTLETNSQYKFQISSKYFIFFLAILVLGTIFSAIFGIIIEVFNLSNSSEGMILILVGITLSPFTIILFLYFYLPSKNILIIESDQVTLKTYRDSRIYRWENIKSIMVKFDPQGKGGTGIGSAITSAIDAVVESISDERSNTTGRISFELISVEDKKKLKFLYLKFGESTPLIEKITELTKTEPQKEKYVRKWEL
ncbi:MAG: hypothetical protein ACW98D_21785 [Promethearchaeota archaeon]|jgi:hypothetical protein